MFWLETKSKLPYYVFVLNVLYCYYLKERIHLLKHTGVKTPKYLKIHKIRKTYKIIKITKIYNYIHILLV